jgi:hypothetical protein
MDLCRRRGEERRGEAWGKEGVAEGGRGWEVDPCTQPYLLVFVFGIAIPYQNRWMVGTLGTPHPCATDCLALT